METELIFVNDNVPFGARGMERYFRHVKQAIISTFKSDAAVFSARPGDYAPARHIAPLRFKGSEQFGLHEFLANQAIRKIQPRLVFSAWFTNLNTKVPQVFVIYDMIYEKFPQYHSRWQTPLRNLARERWSAISRADRIIVISHSAARDVQEIYPNIDPTRLSVIHLGVDEMFFRDDTSPVPKTPPIRPYFLFVGFRSGHKNFCRLIDAFGSSGLQKSFDLRVISRQPFTSEELQRIRRYNAESAVVWMGSLDDHALRSAYRHAWALVYPSEYEGFGLPILEAFAAGTIVATSSISSMPEVGGDVAFYFDPHNIDSLIACLNALADLPAATRRARITQGIARAQTFTWRHCEEQTLQLLHTMLANSG